MDPPSSFAAARFSSELAKETGKDHCRVYSVVVDPTGSHAAACTNDGFVHVWNLGKHLTPLGLTTAAQSPPKPDVSFQAHSGPVFSMCFAPSHGGLVTGGDTETRVWRWSDVLGGGIVAPVLELRNPAPMNSKSMIQVTETNGVAWDATVCVIQQRSVYLFGFGKRFACGGKQSGLLFTAAGDSNAYAWDIVRGSTAPVVTFAGHEDYLHALCALPSIKGIATASEDGTGRLWDVTSGKSIATFAPESSESSDGAWLGAVAPDPADNWCAFGSGSGNVTVYHVGSRIPTTSFKTVGSVHSLLFHGGHILSCGGDSTVRQWSMKGRCKRTIPTLIPTCFSLAVHNHVAYECLLVAGSSPLVDVAANFGSRSFSLST